MPPRTARLHTSLLGLVSLALVLATALPGAFSSGSASAASVGETGNDPRAFPKTFHMWGGYPSSYTKYDLVVGYPAWDIASLRAANPGAIYLANVGLDPFNPDWQQWRGTHVTYGRADTVTGITDTVVDGSAANLGTIPAWNSYWDTLHRPDGSVAAVNSTFRHPGWNLARTETAEKVAKIEAYAAKVSKVYRNGWDGIWSDNWIYRIGASWFYGSDLDTNRDGQRDDLGTVQRQWWDGLSLVGQRLRSYLPGKIVGGNGSYLVSGLPGGSDPSAPFKTTNVTMNEVLQEYTSRPDTIVSEVQSYLGFPDPFGMPRYFMLMHLLPGGQGDYRSLRWGFSLATIAGGYYLPYGGSHNDTFTYDEFTGGSGIAKRGWLGAPVSAPTKLSNGVWRRDFANGVVLNNSTSAAQTVSLGGTFQRLRGTQDTAVNNGASVSSVTIPAGDGLFLSGASSTAPTLQNSTPPAVSGTPIVGQTLSATSGSWSGTPTSYEYQWQRCDAAGANCADALGGTTASYLLSKADVESRMRVKVTARNSSASATAVSTATGEVVEPFGITQSIVSGSTLASAVTWTAWPVGKTVSKVDFAVDGKPVATDIEAPFSTALDTTSLANGSHVFDVQATASDGTTANASVTATVSNQTGTLTVTQSVTNGQTLSGAVNWAATASGKTVARVEFLVDGAVVATDAISPYGTALDTTRLANGAHVFAARAVATDGTTATASASATVSNQSESGTLTVSQNISDGQTLSGSVTWFAAASGKTVASIAFVVDDGVVATDSSAPYELVLDTHRLADRSHRFVVRATAGDGSTASASATATVANAARDKFSVTHNIAADQVLSGVFDWTAVAVGKAERRVEFFVDGKKVATKPSAPYKVSLDTRELDDGSHVLGVTAYAVDGSTAGSQVPVRVSNRPSAPPPAPTAPSLSVSQNVANDQTVSGSVQWTASTTASTERIDFYVDGRLAWTERYAPYVFNGDGGSLDTRTLGDGSHVLAVKAYGTDGSSASASATVVVSNSASGFPLTSSIKDGTTITGLVSWTVLPSKSVTRIEFFIDSVLKCTERYAPYVYGGDGAKLDTSTLTAGRHTFVLKAFASDGEVAVLTLQVTVA